jgi:DNA-binding LacI/PurR family transcriptional regulator
MERKKPTLDDVARLAGVSRSTVSRVVNREDGVTQPAREKVSRAIARLDYRPNAAARALASGRTDVVDLVVIDDNPAQFGTNPYYPRVMTGILNGLAGTDVQMRVSVVAERDAPTRLPEIAEAAGLGTLLVNVTPALAERALRDRDRVVSLGRSAPRVPSIDPDNSAGAQAAIRHLYAVGRRRVAAIHGPNGVSCAIGRRDGYLLAIDEAGLAPISADGGFCREDGVRATRQLLAAHPDLDAIFASCDLTATGVLQVLAEAGRRVPDDVAVVGFDDSVLAMCTTPPLTSVCQPVERIAELATRALLDRLVNARWQHTLPVNLTVRQSTVA